MVIKDKHSRYGDDGVNISGPGGLGISAWGRDVGLIILTLVGFAAMGWFLRDLTTSQHQDHAERRAEHQLIITQHRDLMFEVLRWGDRCGAPVEPRHFDPRETR